MRRAQRLPPATEGAASDDATCAGIWTNGVATLTGTRLIRAVPVPAPLLHVPQDVVETKGIRPFLTDSVSPPSSLPQNHAIQPSEVLPQIGSVMSCHVYQYGVVVSARAAFSHSASVGKRYPSQSLGCSLSVFTVTPV